MITDNNEFEDRAARFQAYLVPSTYELERAQLEKALTDKIMSQAEFSQALATLNTLWGKE